MAISAVAFAFGAGCGEQAGQQDAREFVQAHLRSLPEAGSYRVSDVHCTHSGRLAYFQAVRTTRYFCIARLEQGGDCDLFRVDVEGDGSAKVTLAKPSAGCVLPAG